MHENCTRLVWVHDTQQPGWRRGGGDFCVRYIDDIGYALAARRFKLVACITAFNSSMEFCNERARIRPFDVHFIEF